MVGLTEQGSTPVGFPLLEMVNDRKLVGVEINQKEETPTVGSSQQWENFIHGGMMVMSFTFALVWMSSRSTASQSV